MAAMPPIPGRSERFGPLEWRVLEALWGRSDFVRVRDLLPAFPQTAYTTLMTTLDRLYRKGVLERRAFGRAFGYRPRFSRDQLSSELATDALRHLLASGASPAPILSFLVDAVGPDDRDALDELERLIRERRRGLRGEPP